MKRYIILFLVLISLNNLFSQTPNNDPNWELVWRDDFNTLNTNIWKVMDNFDHYCSNPTVSLSRNVAVSNGSLEMTLKKEDYRCPNQFVNPWFCVCQYNNNSHIYRYTTGSVETQNDYSTQFGYMEARIAFPYNYNFTGAFWTFVKEGIAYSNGEGCIEADTNASEIDIVEFKGNLKDHGIEDSTITRYYLTSCIHRCYDTTYFWDNYAQCFSPPNYEWDDNIWHTYALEWSPNRLIFYVDDYPHRIITDHKIFMPVRILLGLNLMGDTPANANIPLPRKMKVDYVSVYRLKKDCDTELNLCNYNFSNYDNTVKKKITIGNGSCSNSISVGDNVFLRASEEVLINGDFTVPVGAELFIDVDQCER
jgi:beta-glucanase (GH16 family)